jgi:2,3-bisphosphoglycerate-independent phosphoglycerate mutase
MGAEALVFTFELTPTALHSGLLFATVLPTKVADVAPTLLALLGVAQPGEMTGRSLIKRV